MFCLAVFFSTLRNFHTRPRSISWEFKLDTLSFIIDNYCFMVIVTPKHEIKRNSKFAVSTTVVQRPR